MAINEKWSEIGRWKVQNPEKEIEEYIIEKTPSGNFRIKNDFGNIKIEMDEESARKFIEGLYDIIEYYAPKPYKIGGYDTFQDPMQDYDDIY